MSLKVLKYKTFLFLPPSLSTCQGVFYLQLNIVEYRRSVVLDSLTLPLCRLAQSPQAAGCPFPPATDMLIHGSLQPRAKKSGSISHGLAAPTNSGQASPKELQPLYRTH